ncbi:MAG: hypothetical protein ABIG66_02775 [Candidatus Kerfeldbacteria bacterium]
MTARKPSWAKALRYNPLQPLLDAEYEPVSFFVQQDLLGNKGLDAKSLWEHPDAMRIIRRQRKNGSWKYPSKRKNAKEHRAYDWLETYRQVGFLVNKFGFDKRHPALRKAATLLLSVQTKEGDLRAIYGNQHAPNYSSQVFEELIKAGYGNDRRIIKGMNWLLSVRQDDGGWALPFRTKKDSSLALLSAPKTVQLDRSKPFSHFVTGIVLRSFAEHPKYRRRKDIKEAGELLASRFFKADKYADRRAPRFWFGFSYPFWQADLLSSLDTLSKLGFKPDLPQVSLALDWFIRKQKKDGSWTPHIIHGADKKLPLWMQLQICRVFKQYFK